MTLVNPRYSLHACYLGCETGSYGDNCSRKCDHCKNSDTCDIDTGDCDENGCSLSGFWPPICNGKKANQAKKHFVFKNVYHVMFVSFDFEISRILTI